MVRRACNMHGPGPATILIGHLKALAFGAKWDNDLNLDPTLRKESKDDLT